MTKAHIKKMFPGAVTSNGFFSYYNYIIDDPKHIFVIKGGPGVGKSTFMNKIGESMIDRGYDIEFHCCSSDNNSIDGISIPKLGIALLDGTAPHVVDPKNPGAVDEIINLGEYWDEIKMKSSREGIIENNYKVGRYFQCAYFALKEAKTAMDEWEFYISEQQNWAKINEIRFRLEKELFRMIPKGLGKERHLFAWAHSPQGKVQFIDSLLDKVSNLYIINGDPGTGKSSFLTKLAERAISYGLYVEHYHNTLDPTQLDLIIIPEIKTALCVSADPYIYEPQFTGNIISYDFNQSLNSSGLSLYRKEIDNCHERVEQHIQRALANSKLAKQTHDLMEEYYIPAMDFNEINRKRKVILERIYNMMDEESIAVSSSLNKEI